MSTTLIDPVDELTRRRLLTGSGVLGVLTVLPGCGPDGEPAAPPAAEEPKRVVTLGYTDHDPVLALGARPVGLVNWYGEYPFGVWPWARGTRSATLSRR